MEKIDEDYYKELHAAARSYDIKVWSTLVSFLVVISWIVFGIKLDNNFLNVIYLFSAGLVSLILLLKFIKEHGVALLVQKEIERLEGDTQRIPLYSSDKFLELMKERDVHLNSIPFEKWLFKFRVSRLLMWTMVVVIIISFLLFFYFLYNYLISQVGSSLVFYKQLNIKTMNSALFLAQFWGWLLVIFGLIFLFRKKSSLENFFSLTADKGFMLISGYLAFVLGLATVLLHNVWVADWRVVITIFGWLSLIKGAVRVGFPGLAQRSTSAFKNKTVLMRILLVIMVLLGAWLLWMSYY